MPQALLINGQAVLQGGQLVLVTPAVSGGTDASSVDWAATDDVFGYTVPKRHFHYSATDDTGDFTVDKP